jgi:hypothetical protein
MLKIHHQVQAMNTLDIHDDRVWRDIRRLATESFWSSLHYSLASIASDGTPHVTPIGSLRLLPDRTGVYFEIFTQGMARNLDLNPKVCVLAVNSSRWFWLRSLYQGRFNALPGVRLYGEAGPCRAATSDEVAWWERRVGRARSLKGYSLLWGRDRLTHVRTIQFTYAAPVQLGEMTQGLFGRD